MSRFKIGDIVVLKECSMTHDCFFRIEHPYLKIGLTQFKVVNGLDLFIREKIYKCFNRKYLKLSESIFILCNKSTTLEQLMYYTLLNELNLT